MELTCYKEGETIEKNTYAFRTRFIGGLFNCSDDK